MKIGIIIIFYNNALDIDEYLFNGISNLTDMQLCLVNNGSKDTTLEKLQELNDESRLKNTIIDIKQNKGNNAAIKAGARYLFNYNDLKHIGYINVGKFNKKVFLFELLNATRNHHELIIEYNLNVGKKGDIQRPLLKNTFSIIDYLSYLNIKFEKPKIKMVG